MRLRRATAADLEEAGEVTVAAYADFTLGPTDPYIARLRDTATRDREAEVWVATPDDADTVLGCVTLCPPGSPWRELAGPDEGEFRMLAVAPRARGRGVGEALARLCLDRFRDEGCRAVLLSSLPVMEAAHRLYTRLGFRRLPERDWSPVPGVELIAFRLDLTADPAPPPAPDPVENP
jgi:ribosomal protein S18 acetylase RimI-like enzyme